MLLYLFATVCFLFTRLLGYVCFSSCFIPSMHSYPLFNRFISRLGFALKIIKSYLRSPHNFAACFACVLLFFVVCYIYQLRIVSFVLFFLPRLTQSHNRNLVVVNRTLLPSCADALLSQLNNYHTFTPQPTQKIAMFR